MKRLLILVSLLVSFTLCNAEPAFIAGKDYTIIENLPSLGESIKPGTVIVKEFFSYGCPWCYRLEKDLAKWHKALPKIVDFRRIPVIFESGWDVYAKAYYAADILGIDKSLSHDIFNEVQVKKKRLDTNEAMIAFFIKHGISEKIAKSAFLSSPTIDEKVQAGISQMQMLQINSVPNFVINNHYKVDIAMSDGDIDKLFRVIGFLIAKELISSMQKV